MYKQFVSALSETGFGPMAGSASAQQVDGNVSPASFVQKLQLASPFRFLQVIRLFWYATTQARFCRSVEGLKALYFFVIPRKLAVLGLQDWALNARPPGSDHASWSCDFYTGGSVTFKGMMGSQRCAV